MGPGLAAIGAGLAVVGAGIGIGQIGGKAMEGIEKLKVLSQTLISKKYQEQKLKLYRLKPVGSVTRMVFNVVDDHFICNIARCGAKISSPPKSFTPIPSA